jgi:hypothetical protein
MAGKSGGKEIWKSKSLKGGDLATFDLSVQDFKTLELRTGDGGGVPNPGWGLWPGPRPAKRFGYIDFNEPNPSPCDSKQRNESCATAKAFDPPSV